VTPLKAFLEIMRPMNCLMASIAALIGLLVAGQGLSGRASDLTFAIAFLVVFLVTGAGNAVNDYFDKEIDAVNRPGRPIPRGAISPRAALIFSLALFAAGCALAWFLGIICFCLAILNSILLYFYARNLKATPLAGNICVAYLTGSSFLFGGAAFGPAGLASTTGMFLLAALATMSREIAKDIEDIEGDRKGGARTLPIIVGERRSSLLAAVFGFAAVVLSYSMQLGLAYLALVTLADIFFLLSAKKVMEGDAAKAQHDLKLGMAVALAAFLAGALYR